MIQGNLTRFGQNQLFPTALEEGVTDFGLEFLNLNRERRLGNIQVFRGARQVSFVRHGPEIPQVVVVQSCHIVIL